MSQRVAACCCQPCSDPTLGGCCIQQGNICTCEEDKTICECTKLGGVWNANPVCPDSCLGACCVLNAASQPIKCLDNMTKCDCDVQNTTGQTATFSQGQTCSNLTCTPYQCGPDLCLGGNNLGQNIIMKKEYTRSTISIFNSYAGNYSKYTEIFKKVDYSYTTRAVYEQSVLYNPYRNGQIITTYIDAETNNRTVENITYSIERTTNCVDYGCLPNLTYFVETYEGHCSGGPSDNPWSGTNSVSGGTVAFSITNSCLHPIRTGGVDWWSDINGNQTCPVDAVCQAKLNAFRVWLNGPSGCVQQGSPVTTGTAGSTGNC